MIDLYWQRKWARSRTSFTSECIPSTMQRSNYFCTNVRSKENRSAIIIGNRINYSQNKSVIMSLNDIHLWQRSSANLKVITNYLCKRNLDLLTINKFSETFEDNCWFGVIFVLTVNKQYLLNTRSYWESAISRSFGTSSNLQ